MSFLGKLDRWFRHPKEPKSESSNSGLQLIVGLGNPGANYAQTRHNAGERWVRALATEYTIPLTRAARFQGDIGHGTILDHDIRILVPSTYMNLSGKSVGAVLRFFKINPEKMLVVHDEVAFDTGVTKLKLGGGLNGHRGLESIVQSLGGNRNFIRLRIGVGHPGNPNVLSAYLTKHKMSHQDKELVMSSANFSDDTFKALLDLELQRAMGLFHTAND